MTGPPEFIPVSSFTLLYADCRTPTVLETEIVSVAPLPVDTEYVVARREPDVILTTDELVGEAAPIPIPDNLVSAAIAEARPVATFAVVVSVDRTVYVTVSGLEKPASTRA